MLTPPHYCSLFTEHSLIGNSQPVAGVISTAELKKAASTIGGSPQVQLKEAAETRPAPDLTQMAAFPFPGGGPNFSMWK